MDPKLIEPIVQYGFLGFSGVLLAVVVWLIQRLLALLDANNRVIAANTEAIRELSAMTGDLLHINRSLHDRIITRPCIATHER
jgi:hypothetical protein